MLIIIKKRFLKVFNFFILKNTCFFHFLKIIFTKKRFLLIIKNHLSKKNVFFRFLKKIIVKKCFLLIIKNYLLKKNAFQNLTNFQFITFVIISIPIIKNQISGSLRFPIIYIFYFMRVKIFFGFLKSNINYFI